MGIGREFFFTACVLLVACATGVGGATDGEEDDGPVGGMSGVAGGKADTTSSGMPMGGAPAGEAPLSAAKRELREETGLSANQWIEVMHLHTSNSITDERGVVFIAKDLTLGETAFEETEDLTVRKLPVDDAIQMALSGEITDAISVAGLLRLSASRSLGPGAG